MEDISNAFLRSAMLIGEKSVEVLARSHVALFGVGGVGGFVLEGLVRSGVGQLTVIDGDCVSETNLNRQIIATASNVGEDKVTVSVKRAKEINPNVKIEGIKSFFLPENSASIDFSEFDYVIDAVDTVSAKIEIIKRARAEGKPLISCMGTGGKTDPSKLKVASIEKTDYCPLAKVMRRELKKLGIKNVKVVYSDEQTAEPQCLTEERIKNGRTPPPSMIFVPATAGLLIAREVVFDLIGQNKTNT